MTDAHCHVSCGDPSVREFLVGRDFLGVHPWETGEWSGTADEGQRTKAEGLSTLDFRLSTSPCVGVGEIGLDRLRVREISPVMRETFEAQLALAARYARPVVLHGAKCWGEVVRACVPVADRIPAFLFHGFSRSDGLIPDIVRLGGFISVGPAVLNDHAVNYRALVRKIPADRLLVETDRTAENAGDCPPVSDVVAKLAELRGLAFAELETLVDANADSFIRSLREGGF